MYGRTRSFVLQFTVIIFVSKELELSRGTSVMMSGHSSGFFQEPCNKTLQASPTISGSTKHYMQKTANNKQSGVAVMFRTCFRKMVVSNVGRITGYRDGDFYGLRQPPSQTNVGI